MESVEWTNFKNVQWLGHAIRIGESNTVKSVLEWKLLG